MSPRIILYTGKGGVGKTSVAAATARRCAAAGLRTLVLSTDPAHSLADALGEAVASEPTPVADRLDAQQVQAQEELERNWAAVQDWLGELLVARGVDRISAEELTVPPGMDELFSLLALKRHHAEGGYDVIVVDCAPTGETLRLLSFPDVARWWIEKFFPQQGRILSAARPFARAVLDVEHRAREGPRGAEDAPLLREELLDPPARDVGERQQPQRLAGRRAVDHDHVVATLGVVALEGEQREQLVHAGRDGQLLGRDAVDAARDEQLAEPVLHRRPVALELLLGLHLL